MSRRILCYLLLLSGWAALMDSLAHASTSAVAELVGQYQCIVHDSAHKVWHFQSRNSLWGTWLRAEIYYPPQNGSAADVTHTFVGFDDTTRRWNIVALDRAGSYYTRYSHSAKLDGSRWVDGYPADGGRAVLRILPSSGYTFDLTIASSKSTAYSHVKCTRAKT
jgi:hypothetical protein